MKKTKNLVLKFTNGKGKSANYTIRNPKDNLPAEEVRQAMDKMAEANVAEQDAVPLYQAVAGAHYVERTITPVF